MGNQLSKRFLLRTAFAVLLFLALLGFALFHTVAEANRIEAEASRRTVANLVVSQTEQLALLADDNSFWDDAAEAVYLHADRKFFWTSWGSPTSDGKNYSVAAVIDHAGQTVAAFSHGHPVTSDFRAELGSTFDILARKLDEKGQGVGAVVRTSEGIAFLGMADILPARRELDSIIPKNGPSKIVFIRPLSRDMTNSIGEQIQIDDLEIGTGGQGLATYTIIDPAGQRIGSLHWTPAKPGLKILKGSLPWIILGAFIHLGFLAFLVRSGAAILSDIGNKAYVDSLSGLPNRRSLKLALSEHMRAKRATSLAMMDLDGFKFINDSFGHQVGDSVIQEVAQILTEKVGRFGQVARLGGDEFAILIDGEGASERLEKLCASILHRFAKPFRIDDRTLAVGVSIGLTNCEQSDLDVSEVLRRADVAMYAAKRSGKMRSTWFDHTLDQLREKECVIKQGLENALDNEEFHMVYLPQFSARDGRLLTVEALLRWVRVDQREIPASEFVTVAERTGLIDRIGLWAIGRACQDGLAWPDQKIAVNVSTAQLRNPNFASLVRELIDEVGFPADRLQFEISEAALSGDSPYSCNAILALRAIGIKIVLEEFGAGMVSAGRVAGIGVDLLKFDQKLVRQADTDEVARTILQANITIARAIGLNVIAAGVETEAQADLMRVLGCEELQGWHLSKPVTADQITSSLAHASLKSVAA